MKIASKHISRRRREFGALVRQHRHGLGLTCEALAAKVGNISRGAISTIERGERQAGAKVGGRLADALGLTGVQRQHFLVAALKTTASEVLPAEASGFDPEFFMPIWRMLAGNLIKPENIQRISNQAKLSSESPVALKDAAQRLSAKARELSARIDAALNSTEAPFLFDLEVELRDGKIMLVEMISGRGK